MAPRKTRTIKAPGKQPISFKEGGLHQSLGVPAGKPIPAAAMQSALAGKKGPKAQKQANFAVNVLGVKVKGGKSGGGKSAGKGGRGGGK